MPTQDNNLVAPAGATYDETPYPSAAFPQTHPDKLSAMARLFGVNAAALASARVLELGCADGANLLPMDSPRRRGNSTISLSTVFSPGCPIMFATRSWPFAAIIYPRMA
jgi:hypothetical protein